MNREVRENHVWLLKIEQEHTGALTEGLDDVSLDIWLSKEWSLSSR